MKTQEGRRQFQRSLQRMLASESDFHAKAYAGVTLSVLRYNGVQQTATKLNRTRELRLRRFYQVWRQEREFSKARHYASLYA